MLDLKLLMMRCCCEHQNEEVKQPTSPPVPVKKPVSLINVLKSLPKEQNLEDSIIAAPSPITQEVPVYPKLRLKVLESSIVPLGTVLTLNGFGLENSARKKQDFKVFIGSALEDKGEIINDFAIDEEVHGMGKQHLLIKYLPSAGKYTLTDLGDGTGTFVKISSDLVLKEGFIISFGNSHMKVLGVEQKLLVRFLEGPKINEEFILVPQDQTVLIGRMNDCRIKFDDTNLSRYQCHFSYQEGRGWVLKDGANGKQSTNGTWIYVEDEFDMYDKMMFKAGKTLFEATFE